MRTWFYKIGSEAKGPITEEELLLAFKYGDVTVHTVVKEKEFDSWVKISEIKDLLPRVKTDKEKREEKKIRNKLRKINYKVAFTILLPIYLFLILVWYVFFTTFSELNVKVLEVLFSLSLLIFSAVQIICEKGYFDTEYYVLKNAYGNGIRPQKFTKKEKLRTLVFTIIIIVLFFGLLFYNI